MHRVNHYLTQRASKIQAEVNHIKIIKLNTASQRILNQSVQDKVLTIRL
jgi:hypothetical protein